MGAVLKASVGLVIAVAVWSVVSILIGLHRSPLVGTLVFVVLAMALTVAAVFWCLKQTASENGYGRQLLNGLLVGVVAGILIFLFSIVNLSVIFPGALEESKEATIEMVEAAGLPEDTVEEQVRKIEATTPVSQAVPGLIGTVLTATIAGAVVAAFVRRK